MKNIFVYGSLMYEPVWRRLLPGTYHRQPAWLADYCCFQVRGEVYPGVRPVKGGRVDGVLVTGLCASDIRILDRFEGGLYCRQSLEVSTRDGTVISAEVFVVCSSRQSRLSSRTWNRHEFERRYLDRFLRALR